jgi:hypothetical protein
MLLKQPQNSTTLYAKVHDVQAAYELLATVPLLPAKPDLLTFTVIVELCPLAKPVTVSVLVVRDTEPAETDWV